MSSTTEDGMRWWVRGLLFENCNCQLVCPGHVHFDQHCTYERCLGYWAIRFDDGEFEGVGLADTRAIVAYDSPSHMIEGDWTQVLIVDEATSRSQRRAIESILEGEAGGPWSVLARFVCERLPTRYLPIRIEDEERRKRVVVDGVLESTVEAIRGQDRSQVVRFENMFNQIHSSPQVIARGSSRYDDGDIVVDTDQTHGLWSTFRWEVDEAD